MEGLAIGNGLAEVVCGTIIITISLYLQFSVGRKAVGKRVLVDQYLFPMAFVLTGLLLFGRAVCIGNGWLKVSALLATLSAPIVGMLLFLPTFGWLSASGRHRKCHWGWLLVEALALDAIVVVRRASGVEMWATMYCLLAGIFMAHSSLVALRAMQPQVAGGHRPATSPLCRRLALAWMGINIFSLLPVVLNVAAFMPLATVICLVLVTVCCFCYAVDYGRRMEESMERDRPVVDTRLHDGAGVSAEAVKPVVQVVYETVTTDERIKGKLQKWVESKGFCQTGVTINDLSKQIGINRTYLSKHINECYSCNFNCWINKLRVREAEEMMRRNPDLPLSDVADQVGYADISHFSRQFKYIKGEPPSLYGKKIRQTSDLTKCMQ